MMSAFFHFQHILNGLYNHVLVLQFKGDEISYYQIEGEVMKDENILDKKQMFVGFLIRIHVISCYQMEQSLKGNLTIFAKHA